MIILSTGEKIEPNPILFYLAYSLINYPLCNFFIKKKIAVLTKNYLNTNREEFPIYPRLSSIKPMPSPLALYKLFNIKKIKIYPFFTPLAIIGIIIAEY